MTTPGLYAPGGSTKYSEVNHSHANTGTANPSLAYRSLTTRTFPIACLQEPGLGSRYGDAKAIEQKIRGIAPGFSIRVEHLAAILLVKGEDLKDNGHLSHKSCSPYELKDRLCGISPFCKHCKNIRATIKIELTDQIIDMLHLDPTNEERLDKKEWAHALPQLPKPEPRPEPGMSFEDTAMSIHYLCRFRTGSNVPDLSPDLYKKVEAERKVRDEHKYIKTGRSNPRIFWFIPRKFNNTRDHNDATGYVRQGCMYLTKINFLHNIHSATELGKTYEIRNLLCVDSAIYDALTLGLCAFKYISKNKIKIRKRKCRGAAAIFLDA